MEKYYTPSGNVSPLAYLLFLATAIILIPILAALYAYAIWYIPIPYINFFITGIFGLATGWVISKVVIKYGKVRSKKWSLIFAVLGALIAIYVHWAVWVDLVFNISGTMGSEDLGIATSNANPFEVLALMSNPGGLFSTMKEINQIGVWGIKGGTVSGTFLTVIWVIEFLIIFLLTIMNSLGQSDKPFCEEENNWFNETTLSPTGVIQDPQGLLSALAQGNQESISNLIAPSTDSEVNHHSLITLYDAKTGDNYLSIENKIAKKDDNDKISFDDQPLVNYLKVSQQVIDGIKGKVALS